VEAIRSGRADAVLAGGTDALSRLTYSGFNLLRLMDPIPCRPFDRSRAGMNIGEGAGILVLEDLERARKRGAPIYAEVAGHSLACEAFHPTAPEPEGKPVAAVVSLALRDAGINPDDVQHINAHGTATPQNDTAEARGFRRVFGDRVDRIPVTSIKSMIGHCLGAAGAVEAAVLALTVARGAIPPTIHHSETDGDCAIDVVANDAREQRVRCAVSTSLGFGGNDSAIVLRAV
jgi:3-oxoacyl-[acyl-carrier-protein] synthase II